MPTTTRTITVDPQNPAPEVLREAADILKGGRLVAFATETVYGLGADATNPEAVARIFEAKGRPAFNPLIVHAADSAMARSCVAEWPEAAQALDAAFWPGPLTLVLPRSSTIPDIVTAGRDTVGVRIPKPAVARFLIGHTGRPVAAPSANRSTGLSPTLVRHVLEDLDGRVDLILDSGQTVVGLESTVLDLTTRRLQILRPGPITAAQIERVLGRDCIQTLHQPVAHEALSSPGQMAIHYAPRTRAVRVDSADDLATFGWPARAVLLAVGEHRLPSLPADLYRFALKTPGLAAQDLYVVLHQCDAMNLDLIVVLPPPDQPEWAAVRDRLRRATQPL